MKIPEHQTERHHAQFKELVLSTLNYGDFARESEYGQYTDRTTARLFRIWWAQERERQMLQNLNQAQGAEISRLMNKIKQLEAL